MKKCEAENSANVTWSKETTEVQLSHEVRVNSACSGEKCPVRKARKPRGALHAANYVLRTYENQFRPRNICGDLHSSQQSEHKLECLTKQSARFLRISPTS
jgi:hypothetical protein